MTETQILWATLGGAVLLTGQPLTWRMLRHVVTIAHEGGHALAAVLVGRRLAGVRLHSDTSGLTVSSGKPTGPGMVFTALAGYPAPSLVGAGFAVLLATERVTPLLWLAAGLLLVLLVQVRNAFGVLTVVATGAAVLAAIRYGSPRVELAFSAAACWLLLVGGLRAVIELQRTRRRSRGRTSDADQLARLTGLPGLAWVTLFAVVALAALAGSGWVLLAADLRGVSG